MRIATQKEKFTLLGAPGDTTKLSRVNLPKNVKFVLSWKLGYEINRFQANTLIVPHLEAIYKEIFATLTPNLIEASGICIFGGCYAFRPIRGTEKRSAPPFSAHSWAGAVDHDPIRNGLYTNASRANLAKPEFDPIHDIFRKYGFLNMGHVIGRDFMHYEASFELLSNPAKFL